MVQLVDSSRLDLPSFFLSLLTILDLIYFSLTTRMEWLVGRLVDPLDGWLPTYVAEDGLITARSLIRWS